MKKNIRKIIGTSIILVFAAIYYYISLPALNIHSVGFWKFLLFGVFILFAFL